MRTVRFSPLTARRILRVSLEKIRLLSMSLGPLMCRTLDHLLCPAEAVALTCSVLCGAAPQPGFSCWETHQGPTRNPRHRARKLLAAVSLRLAAAQDIIFHKGLQGAKGNSPKSACLVWHWTFRLLLQLSRNSQAQLHLKLHSLEGPRRNRAQGP